MTPKSKPQVKSKSAKPVMRLYLVSKGRKEESRDKWAEIAVIWRQKPGFYNVDFSLPLDLRPFFFNELFSFVLVREDEKEKAE